MPPGWMAMAALLLPLLLPCSTALYSPSGRGVFAPSNTRANSNTVEGDIAVPGTHIGSSAQESFLADVTKLWPNGFVYYRFEMDDFDGVTEHLFLDEQVANITTALDHIMQEVPCIKFRPVRPDYTGAHLIYTLTGDLNNAPHLCYSYVGRVGGQGGRRGQVVNLGSPGCLSIGVILHETLHALGAQHEHMRDDRDRFVTIEFENILPGKDNNFRLKAKNTYNNRNTPFDEHSVMIYGSTDFGRDDNMGGEMITIRPKNPGMQISGASSKLQLSLVDKIELGRAYQNITDETCFVTETLELYAEHVDSLRNVCQEKTACPLPWTKLQTGCYLFLASRPLTWHQGKAACQEAGGHMLEVDTQMEQTAVQEEMNSNGLVGPSGPRGYWMGLTDRKIEGSWVWETSGKSTSSGFTNWAPNEPNNGPEAGGQDCGMMYTRLAWDGSQGGKWDDANCARTMLGSKLHGVICEII